MKTDGLRQLVTVGDLEEEGLFFVSVSRLKTWKSCQQKYHYKYIKKLRPKKKSRPLTLGGLVHKCLEAYDMKEDWVQVIRDYNTKEFSKLFLEEKAELGDIPRDTLRICRAYFNHYSEIDKHFETLACEVGFMIRVPGTKVVIEGIIDKVARNTTTNKIWGIEHKTAKKGIPSETYRATDIQTTVYEWALAVMAPKLGFEAKDLAGIMFNYLKTKPPTIPRVLKNGSMSRAKIDCDKWTYIEALKKAKLDPEDYKDFIDKLDTESLFRRIPLAKSKAMVNCIMNDFMSGVNQMVTLSDSPTRNLAWTCDAPRCEYRELCMAEIQGLDVSGIVENSFEKREEEENVKDREEESEGRG